MSASVNKIILIGNVGKDPVVNQRGENTIGSFSIATTRRYTKDGQRLEDTEWHYLTVFGKIAEIVQKYVRKGSSVYVCGRLRTRKWQAESGQMQYRTEVIVEEIQLLSGMNREEGSTQSTSLTTRKSSYQSNAVHRPAPVNDGIGDDPSDIPF